jgi:D-glycero-D-manno-heptose 1,7-bisphosphate phosphatase
MTNGQRRFIRHYSRVRATRAVFLDLGGTLVEPVRVSSPGDFRVLPQTRDALVRLRRGGYLCPVVTIQSRIAAGDFNEDEFRTWFRTFERTVAEAGGMLHGVYLCPHAFRHDCPCKKPKTLLFEDAICDLRIDVRHSVVIGDTGPDIEAAERLGVPSCLVLTGWGSQSLDAYGSRATFVAEHIGDAVEWLGC